MKVKLYNAGLSMNYFHEVPAISTRFSMQVSGSSESSSATAQVTVPEFKDITGASHTKLIGTPNEYDNGWHSWSFPAVINNYNLYQGLAFRFSPDSESDFNLNDYTYGANDVSVTSKTESYGVGYRTYTISYSNQTDAPLTFNSLKAVKSVLGYYANYNGVYYNILMYMFVLDEPITVGVGEYLNLTIHFGTFANGVNVGVTINPTI